MLRHRLRQAVQQKTGIALPGVVGRFFRLLPAKVLPSTADIPCSAGSPAHPFTGQRPGLRLQNVIQPQPLTLLRAERLADTHGRQADAGPEHQVIYRVIRQAAHGMKTPDVRDTPIIQRIHAPAVPVRLPCGPRPVRRQPQFAPGADGEKTVERLIRPYPHQGCSSLTPEQTRR